MAKPNTSGTVGVVYSARDNVYRSYIDYNRVRYSLGSYPEKLHAITARLEAESHNGDRFIEWYENKYDAEYKHEILKHRFPRLVEIGKTYRHIKVIGVNTSGKFRRYDCECVACGKKFVTQYSKILNGPDFGCGCLKQPRISKKMQSMVNRQFGQLKVLSIDMTDTARGIWMFCECECKNIVRVKAQRLLDGNTTSCGHDKIKILVRGREIMHNGNINGSNIYCVNPERSINKNNSTGYKGVCSGKNGKYRAYIMFQRKQYDLGLHDDISDAISARKHAENKIFGEFIKWYNENYRKEKNINEKEPR